MGIFANPRPRTYLLAAVLLAALIGIGLFASSEVQRRADVARPIEGVQMYADLSRNHVEGPMNYPQRPAVGGDHSRIWTNCGSYDQPVDEMETVHSLEHGAVWITYRPELGARQVQALKDLVGNRSYVVLSPFAEQPSPVAATAWGVQLLVESPDDVRLDAFLNKYIQGEQTPEPGAPCTGGSGGMDR